LFIALLATLSGAETCSDMAQFARSRKALLRTVLTLEHGAPSHDTFAGCSGCSTRMPSKGVRRS